MSQTDTVKVELELPRNLWRALCLVAEKFEEKPDRWVAHYVKQQLEADVDDYFRLYVEELLGPLCREIKNLIGCEKAD